LKGVISAVPQPCRFMVARITKANNKGHEGHKGLGTVSLAEMIRVL